MKLKPNFFTRIFIFLILVFYTISFNAQVLGEDPDTTFEIDPVTNANAIQVINAIFGQDMSSQVTNVTMRGGGGTRANSQIGVYSDLDTRLPYVATGEGYGAAFLTSFINDPEDGLVTSDNNTFPDSFNVGKGETDNQFGNDAIDVASLSFDINVTSQSLFTITAIFASDEYLEFVDTNVNDAAKVFINGVNIALVNGSELSIDTVNDQDNSSVYNNNPSVNNGSSNLPFEYDGVTDELVFTTTLAAGTHTIKIGIADRG